MIRWREDGRGQGLVEYALILVLVAVVVIASLLILGPSVGNVFSGLIDQLESLSGPGTIVGVSTGRVMGNVRVTVTVSEPTSVTVSIREGSGTISGSNPQSCTGTCQFTITSPSPSGKVRVSGGGGFRDATWSP